MCFLIDKAIPEYITNYIEEPDTVVKNWFPLNRPINFIAILSIYFSILLILHRIMRERKPLDLRNIMIGYNFCQSVYSAYICMEIVWTAYLSDYRFSCAQILSTRTALGHRMAYGFWLFYLSKIFDLTDTVFFVLRKKSTHISYLHLYHHTTMLFNWYIGTLYQPGGQAALSVIINSFVHVVMYTYYMLSAMGPKVRKYLWWKKYLTQLQLGQFMIVIMHLLYANFTECKQPKWLAWFTITYMCTLCGYFLNFYKKSYNRNKTPLTQVQYKEETKQFFKDRGDYKHE